MFEEIETQLRSGWHVRQLKDTNRPLSQVLVATMDIWRSDAHHGESIVLESCKSKGFGNAYRSNRKNAGKLCKRKLNVTS